MEGTKSTANYISSKKLKINWEVNIHTPEKVNGNFSLFIIYLFGEMIHNS